jgi:PEP-CTERM motif
MSYHHLKASCVLLAMTFLASAFVDNAAADPLPGRDLLKFSQKPMIATPIQDTTGVTTTYGGHDELSTAYGFITNAAQPPQDYSGRFMADDFADNLSSPIVHVKWWGSYHNDFINPQMPVNKFLISFESDMPAGPVPSFSRPDQPLLNQVVTLAPTLSPGSGTYTEKLIRGPDPVVNESLYEYNAELHLGKDFPELKDTVYWLKVVAMVDVVPGITFPTSAPPPFVTQWGWHNRDYTLQNTLASPNVVGPPFPPGEAIAGTIGANTPVWHFQDDAVTGDVRILPGPNGFVMPTIFQQNYAETKYLDLADGPAGAIPGAVGISSFSKDLAFELYTVVPEPTACLLMGIGLAGVFSIRRRSRNA